MAKFNAMYRGIVKDECTGEDLHFFEVFLPGEQDFGSYFFYLTTDGRLAKANKDFNVLNLDEHDEESKAFRKEMLEEARKILRNMV